MTETPHAPTSKILETRVYRGAERVVLRAGHPPGRRPRRRWRTSRPTRIPGFTDHLLETLPGLREHSCSRGARGGFVERLHEGTWLGHVAEHVALQLQQDVGHDIRRGKTRQVKGEPRPLQRRSSGTSTSRSGSRPASSPYGWSTTWSQPDPEFDFDARAGGVHPARRADRVRPLDPGDPRRGGVPRHPVDPAEPVLAGPARPGRPRQADPGHHDLGDRRSIAVDIASDKDLTTRLLGAAGLPVPKPESVRTADEAVAVGRPDRLPGRGASRWTATTAAACAWTCRTRTTSARRSRSPRSSPGAAG